MTPLQQDSERRISEYQKYRDEAKAQGQAILMRRWAKALEEEYHILAMIKRVEALDTIYEQERSDNGKGEQVALSHECTC